MKRVLMLIVAICMTVACFSGCGKKNADEGQSNEVSWWVINYASDTISNYGEVESFKKIQEDTGINIKFIHPSAASVDEQFNIMIASGDYPDIITWNWNKYNGGLERANKDGVIECLDNYAGIMPNYMKYIEDNKNLEGVMRTTEDELFLFYTVKDDVSLNSYCGPIIRKDWLDKLGLEMPSTIGDWYNTLKAFKEKDPNGNGQADEIPYAEYSNQMFKNFAAAWGVIGGAFHYNKNGEVVYGSIQPEYKEFIKEMNKWYKEGLIDPEFPSINKNIVDSNMTSGISGATIGLLGSQLGNYIKAGDPATGYKLAGAEYPSLDENSPHYCGFTNMTKMVPYGDGTAVTAKSKNKEVAIKLLDYMYSGAAFDTLNYGIEGKSYTILENGERRFTDDILNNKEGKSPSQAIIPYALTIYGVGPKVMSSDAYNQAMNNFPEQKDASKKWGESDLSLLPVAAPLTTDENTKVTKMMADIKTYESEMFVKMVVGIEPIESFDKFVQKIKEFGIDEVVEIYKNAYKRAEAK